MRRKLKIKFFRVRTEIDNSVYPRVFQATPIFNVIQYRWFFFGFVLGSGLTRDEAEVMVKTYNDLPEDYK